MADNLASTLSQSPDHLTSHFLQCVSCKEIYNEEKNFPRLLPCLHTYCDECVKKLIQKQRFQCCICSATHKISQDELDLIYPKDYTRRDLMDFVKVKRAPSAIFCTICPQSPASHRCRDCGEFLCAECVTAHQRVRPTAQHQLIELEKLSKSQDLNAFCRGLKCHFHPEKDLELYCSKKSCMKPTCVLCTICSHKEGDGHIVESLGEIEKMRQDNIGNAMKNLSDVKEDVEKVTARIEEESSDIKKLQDSVNIAIDNTFDDLQKIIENGRSYLKEQLKEFVTFKQSVLGNQKSDMISHRRQIQDSLYFSQQALEYKNGAAFLQIDRTISAELKRLTEKWYDKTPHEIATFGFMMNELVTEVEKCVSERASIWTSSVYLPQTQIKQNEEATENKDVTFVVIFNNHHGEQVTKKVNLSTLEASVDGPSGKMDCKVSFKPGSGNEIHVLAKPTVSGSHILELKILDKVVGSQTFEVKSGAPSRPPRNQPEVPKRLNSSHGNSSCSKPSLATASTEFIFDKTRVPKDVTVSADGKVFQNKPSSSQPDSLQSNPSKFKGVMGNRGFKQPGRYYYKLKIEAQIKKPLDDYELVFEIGIARKSAIGPKIMVQGSHYAWSLIGQTHASCKSTCSVVAQGNQCVLHDPLVSNTTGSTISFTYGFLLDTDAGQWKIFKNDQDKEVCIVNGINCTEELFPTVAAYNPKKVDVTVTLINGFQKK